MNDIRITDLRGVDQTAIPHDHPIRIEVSLPRPASGDPAATIVVDVSTPSDTESVTLAWTGNIGGPAVYRSNPLTVSGGGEGGGSLSAFGFETSTGDLEGLWWKPGDTVTVTTPGTAATASTSVYTNWYEISNVQLREALNQQLAALDQLEAELDRLPAGVDTTDARRLLEQRRALIQRGLGQLDNPNLRPGQQLVAGKFYLQMLHDENLTEFDLESRLRQEKFESNDRMLEYYGQIAIGLYTMVTEATGTAQVSTLFFGQTIMGRAATWDQRVLAALDLASGAAMEGAGLLSTWQRLKRADASAGAHLDVPTRTAAPDVPSTPRGVHGHTPGTAVDHLEYGIPRDALIDVRAAADEFGVVIELRPANVDSMPWQQLGHPRKPEKIKQKTVSDVDVHLGADPASIGLVGYFEPKLPTRTADMSDDLWNSIQSRHAQRMKEFEDGKVSLGALQDAGKVRLENGLIVDTGLCGGTGKAITGDYDAWRITKDGRMLDAQEAAPIISRLTIGPADLQHGCHRNWNAPPELAHIDEKIRNSHIETSKGGGGETVLAVGGYNSGPPRATYDGVDVDPSALRREEGASAAPPGQSSAGTDTVGGGVGPSTVTAGLRTAHVAGRHGTETTSAAVGEAVADDDRPWWATWPARAAAAVVVVLGVAGLVVVAGGDDDEPAASAVPGATPAAPPDETIPPATVPDATAPPPTAAPATVPDATAPPSTAPPSTVPEPVTARSGVMAAPCGVVTHRPSDLFPGSPSWFELFGRFDPIDGDLPPGAVTVFTVQGSDASPYDVPIGPAGDFAVPVPISSYGTYAIVDAVVTGPDGTPIDVIVAPHSITVTAAEGPVDGCSPPTPFDGDPVVLAAPMIDQLADAHLAGDADLLLRTLHPATIDRYGPEQCAEYVDGVVGSFTDPVVRTITAEPWDFPLDDRTTPVPDGVTVGITATFDGTTLDADVHLAPFDPGPGAVDLGWFADCGDPL